MRLKWPIMLRKTHEAKLKTEGERCEAIARRHYEQKLAERRRELEKQVEEEVGPLLRAKAKLAYRTDETKFTTPMLHVTFQVADQLLHEIGQDRRNFNSPNSGKYPHPIVEHLSRRVADEAQRALETMDFALAEDLMGSWPRR
ncbi:MAG: hypothetical protein ACYC5Y_05140 [Symbiobacteriia bacterium]